MAIDAVFLHDDGYRYNQVYASKKRFISSLNRCRNAVFVNAVDFDTQEVIYPSNLPDYKARVVNRKVSNLEHV